jgi:hypothetical protein
MADDTWNDIVSRVKQIEFKVLLLFCGLFTGYIIYQIFQTERTLISWATMAMMIGLIFESMRLGSFTKKIIFELLLAYLASFIVFIPVSVDEYDFVSKISTWPAVFFGAYALTSMVLFKDRIIPKINMTYTAVCLLAFMYYVYEWNWFSDDYWLFQGLAFLALGITLFVLVLSIRPGALTQRIRLILSVFSALLMIFFAAEFALELYLSTQYAREVSWLEKLNLFVPYFVLGMGLVYTLQNIFLIIDFNYWGDGDHVQHARTVAALHLKRYDPMKPSLLRLFAPLALVAGILTSNHIFDFVAKQTAVWIVLILVTSVDQYMYRLEKQS